MKASREIKRKVAMLRRKYGGKNGVICGALMFWVEYRMETDKKNKEGRK